MKICVAQTRPIKGDIQKNIEAHKKLITLAISNKADIIVFPELSITGYEPQLAKDLATNQDDVIFDDFQEISSQSKIIICVGMPTKADTGILISMIIFEPDKSRKTYSKQYLHEEELPYFTKGNEQIILNIDYNKIAPAICYESLLPEHLVNAVKIGANIYIASVAKSAIGVEKVLIYFPEAAKKYSIPILMSNCVGHCDNFESVGQSSIWNSKGELLGQLNDTNEGVLVFDTESEEVIESYL